LLVFIIAGKCRWDEGSVRGEGETMSILFSPHYDRIDCLAAVKSYLDVGLDSLAVSVGSGCRWISWIPLGRALAVSRGA
jgi:hypothetical protein